MVQILCTLPFLFTHSDPHHAADILGHARVQHPKAKDQVGGMCLCEYQRRVGALQGRVLSAQEGIISGEGEYCRVDSLAMSC